MQGKRKTTAKSQALLSECLMRQALKGSKFPKWKTITCLPEGEPARLGIPTFRSMVAFRSGCARRAALLRQTKVGSLLLPLIARLQVIVYGISQNLFCNKTKRV